MAGRALLSLRHVPRPPRWAPAALVVVVVVAVVGAAPVARADDRSTIVAVLAAQFAQLRQEHALNKCLAASPHKNTPCTLREARNLANLDDRLVKSITTAMDGTERPCVRTVAVQMIAYLKLWKHAMLLLRANKRQASKRLVIKSEPLFDSMGKLEKTCFPEALGPGP